MLPLLIKMILAAENDENKLSLQTAVLAFFSKHYELTQLTQNV